MWHLLLSSHCCQTLGHRAGAASSSAASLEQTLKDGLGCSGIAAPASVEQERMPWCTWEKGAGITGSCALLLEPLSNTALPRQHSRIPTQQTRSHGACEQHKGPCLTVNFHWFWPLIPSDFLEGASSAPGGCWRVHTAAWAPRSPGCQLNRCHSLCAALLLPSACPAFVSSRFGLPFILQMPHSTKSSSFLCSFCDLSLSVQLCVWHKSNSSVPRGPDEWPRKETAGNPSEPAFHVPCQSSGHGSLRCFLRMTEK